MLKRKRDKMKTKFVELQVEGFRAVLPSLKALPAIEILPLLSAGSDNAMQFVYVRNLLRSKVAEELVDAFDLLDLDDTIKFVTQWIEKSNEGEDNE